MSKQGRQWVRIPHGKPSGWKTEHGNVWLTSLHLCRSVGYYLYLLKLRTPSGNAGVVVAVESSHRKGSRLWEWLSHTSALLSLLITALVAAQQCKPPSASWGNRSWCLLRVLNQPAAEVRVILFCQLCMHYQCRWHGSSTGLQQMEIFH